MLAHVFESLHHWGVNLILNHVSRTVMIPGDTVYISVFSPGYPGLSSVPCRLAIWTRNKAIYIVTPPLFFVVVAASRAAGGPFTVLWCVHVDVGRVAGCMHTSPWCICVDAGSVARILMYVRTSLDVFLSMLAVSRGAWYTHTSPSARSPKRRRPSPDHQAPVTWPLLTLAHLLPSQYAPEHGASHLVWTCLKHSHVTWKNNHLWCMCLIIFFPVW